ncbi:CapA family protein [Nocardioides guangzhouensis]|uniref:CapA family protein n=1 Tax=Nocardioides guangzhouensis TaxID=2497878 RepID=A0A4Q4Z4N9_9ACTN|nr:CapA family protein [Nocardioides guangzhouensis]
MTLLLCGDVMLGRGIDQILGHPGDPLLIEGYVRDARQYVALAEEASGPVPYPVDDTWPWGAALAEIEHPRPDAFVLNLETGVTRCSDFVPGKGIHYRMDPGNLGCLLAARPDVVVVANNHVMDFGRRGLDETLRTLSGAGLVTVGAGPDRDVAGTPAVVAVDGQRAVAVLAAGHESSGVPASWAATADRPGVAFLPDLSSRTAASVAAAVRAQKQRGAIVVVSLHWGSNWGYDVARRQVRFAHWLVDAGADVVHGHSSHHPRPMEVYAGRLVLYGCGDFVNDYEGIRGHEEYRGDLRLLYRVRLSADGALAGAELVPFRSRRLRLEPVAPSDVRWLASVLDGQSRRYGVRVRPTPEGLLVLE